MNPEELALHAGLTPAQAAVWLQWAGGRDLAEIARERGSSLATVRNQAYTAKARIFHALRLTQAIEGLQRGAVTEG